MTLTSYRKDNRDATQFAKDIKTYSKTELDIAVSICKQIKQESGEWPNLIPTGTDFTGEFSDKATSDCDYAIDDVSVEITHSNNHCKKFFHQKENKVKRIIKKKESIVYVDGFSKNTGKYIWLTHTQLKKYTKMAIDKYGVLDFHPTRNGAARKNCYRYDLDWFQQLWMPYTPYDKVPRKYKKLHDQVHT